MSVRPLTIHLVRHGETAHYHHDAGLTDTGLDQARQRGGQLATDCAPHAAVSFAHATSERARATAMAVCEEFVSESAQRGRNATVTGPRPDPRFDNLAVQVGEHRLEPTRARALISSNKRGRSAADWMVEADRFWRVHDTHGDAMGFWLHTPLVWHESPASVVRRIIAAAVESTMTLAGTDLLVVATHSACLRAVVVWAAGADPGEPGHAEQVLIRVDPQSEIINVSDQGGDEQRTWRHPLVLADWQ